MNILKQHSNNNILSKIDLLESNVNRLVNQHQALHKLLQETETITKLKNQINLVEETILRMQNLKVNAQRDLNINSKQLYKSKLRNNSLDSEIRNCQCQVEKIKQQINKLKRDELYSSKNYLSSIQAQYNQNRKNNLNQMSTLKKNYQKYLQNVKKDIASNHQIAILDYIGHNLSFQSQPYCQDIQSQIGLLICELQYENYLHNKGKIQNQIMNEEHSMNNLSNRKKQELYIGKIQRQTIRNDLRQFISQTSARIMYDCSLLLSKIQLAIECVKSNNKLKNKTKGVVNAYQQNKRQFKRKMERIGHQIQGMKLRVQLMLNKLKILDAKIKAIKQSQQQYSIQFDQNYQQIEINYLQCQQKQEQFAKLAIQFVFQSN